MNANAMLAVALVVVVRFFAVFGAAVHVGAVCNFVIMWYLVGDRERIPNPNPTCFFFVGLS